MEANQKVVAEAADFVAKLNDIIFFPLIYLLMAVAFFVFLWGTAQYVINANNDSAREQGKKHIMYGLFGLLVMVSAWSLLSIVAGTFGLADEVDCAKDPTESGCEDVFKVDTARLKIE